MIYLDEDEQLEEINEHGDQVELEDDVKDLAKLTFKMHNSSVFCSSFSIDGTLAATGGEDDIGFLWKTNTGEVLLECTGHSDSIVEVGFSFDGRYIATGDMAGLVQVWSVDTRTLVWCSESDEMEWMQWHPSALVLLMGSSSGDVYMWKIPQGDCKLLPSHGSQAHCGRVLDDGRRLLVGE